MRFQKMLGVGLSLFGLLGSIQCRAVEKAMGAEAQPRPTPMAAKSSTTETNAAPKPIVPLAPSSDDARIAQLTAQLLARAQYLRQPFDDTVSSNLLARLIKDLDPLHMHFLQADIADFNKYQFQLDDLTMKYGDTTPAYDIFNRFLKRLDQRVTYSADLLKHEKFSFTNDDRIVLNRKDLPYPKDMSEAHQLWRERMRFEYLQEKLNLPVTNKVSETNSAPKTPEDIYNEIVKTLTRRLDRSLKTFKDWDSDNVLQFYLDTLAHVYDPHSDYLGRAQAEEFAIGMNLSLFGIGALLTAEDGYCKVKEIKPGPALKDGHLKNNDRIVAVAQGTNEPVDVVDMPLGKVVQLIRGPKDTEVRLTVIPGDSADSTKRKTISIVRDEIKLEDQEAKAKILETTNKNGTITRVGVIDLPSFYAPVDNPGSSDKSEPHYTSVDVARLLKKLQQEKVTGVILDLRHNGGGSLEEAIRLTGLFIRRGTVVQVRDPLGVVLTDDDEDPEIAYDGPLAVLTDRFSASASEILAGALQDYGRALIIGDSSTYGKGTVQSLTQLRSFLRGDNWETNDPGAIKVTIRKFYRPSGSSTQLKGVIPDIILPSVNNLAEVGESNSDSALPWDTIQAAHIVPVNRVAPYVTELRTLSSQRVDSETDYKYIREDMGIFKKAMADKAVSLNEAKRLKEKQEAEAREKARKQELAARARKPETIYDFSLKQAELPGLPAPTVKTNTLAKAAAPKLDSASVATADDDEDITPAVDVNLDEARQIMTDYVTILSHESIMAADKPASAKVSTQE